MRFDAKSARAKSDLRPVWLCHNRSEPYSTLTSAASGDIPGAGDPQHITYGDFMKRLSLILAAVLTLGACTATPEMIAAQKDRCTQLGYTPGTLDHAQCAERGTGQQQAAQNAVAASAASQAISTALIRSFF